MAEQLKRKYRINQKQANGSLVVLHPETEADIVLLDPSIEGIEATHVQGAIAELHSDIVANAGSISGLDTRLGTAEGEIDALQAADTGIISRLELVEDSLGLGGEGETGGVAEQLGALTTRVTTAEGEIDKLQEDIVKKVDAVEGKGLSTNDFTNELKTKLEGLENYELPSDVVQDANYAHITVTENSVSDGTKTFTKYDDTALAGRVSTVEGAVAEIENKDAAVLSEAKGYTDTKVAELVNSAPEALDTLGELATALNNHEDAYDALLETVGSKANSADVYTKGEVDGFVTTINGNVDNKVDKVDGKGLSANDFTDELLAKLNGIEEGANKYELPSDVVQDANYAHITVTENSVSDGTNTFTKYVLPEDVVQDADYVHTDNNFTTEEKNKLAGLNNYDDTALAGRVSTAEGEIDKLQEQVAKLPTENTWRPVNVDDIEVADALNIVSTSDIVVNYGDNDGKYETSFELANVVAAGVYSAVQVDSKGRVIAGAVDHEIGTAENNTPSTNLAVGGIFYEYIG